MGKFFNRIKRNALIIRIVKALLSGVSAALPTIGILMLLKRFERIGMETKGIILTGVGVFLAVGVLVYLLLHRSSKSIAIKLDKEKRLSERIQTSLAFSDQSGPMLELQRQDADEKLMEVKNVALGLKRLWIYILALVLCAGVFVTTFLFNPLPEPPPEPIPETPFAVSEFQLRALEELVVYVENSGMDSPYKENIITALNEFIVEITAAENLTQKDTAIDKVMDELFTQTGDSSYALEIINSLWATGIDSCKLLAKALNYYEWPSEGEWEKFIERMTDYRTSFVHIDSTTENPDEEKMKADVKELLLVAGQSVDLTLEITRVPDTDLLCIALTRLTNANEENEDGTRVYGLLTLALYIEENGYTKAQRELDTTISKVNSDIFKALSQNAINTKTGEYAMTQIASLFDVRAPEFERPSLYETTDPNQPGSDNGPGGGAIGSGPSYGSDDKVYDPFTNKYVEYGTILDKYYNIMFGGLSSGDYTDDEKKALEEYFQILYGGFEESNDKNKNN